jgi:hypothetical protein
MQKLLLYFAANESDGGLASFEINKKNKEENINFHGKMIKVHSNFRLIFSHQSMKLIFSRTFMQKVHSVIMEIEDEEHWKATISDLIINTFFKEKK